MDAAVKWMEDICLQFSANPKAASDALLQFRESESAINASTFIIEHSQLPLAQFHATCCLQAAALRQWEALSSEIHTQLHQFAWSVCLSRGRSIDRAVLNQLLQTLALFWKRSWQQKSQQEKTAIWENFQSLASGPDATHLFLVAKALATLIEEFSATKSVAMGLPLEFHKHTHTSFQNDGLLHALSLAMTMLGRILQGLKSGPNQVDSELVVAVLSLSVSLLSWDFGGDSWNPWKAPSSQNFIIPPSKLADGWRLHLIQPDFLQAMFGMYEQMIAIPGSFQAGHLTRQLLIQLCSIRGPVFETTEQRAGYASLLLQGAGDLLSRRLCQSVNEPDETLELCTMVGRLVSNFGVGMLASLSAFQQLLCDTAEAARQLLVNISTAAQGCSELEEIWQMEAFDLLLETWVVVIEDPYTRRCLEGQQDGQSLISLLVERGLPIYEQYLITRLTLSRLEAERYCNRETEDEEETIERANLDEQLSGVACLGRLAFPFVADMLYRFLAAEGGCLQRLAALLADPSIQASGSNHPVLAATLEECYMLILCAGHLLADESAGEEPMVPDLLLLGTQAARSNSASDYTSLVSLIEVLRDLQNNQVKLISQSNPEDPRLSPHLNYSLLWFFSRIIRPYYGNTKMLPLNFLWDEASQQNPALAQMNQSLIESSKALTSRFGTGDQAISDLTGQLEACWLYVVQWATEPEVARAALDVAKAVLNPGGPGKLIGGHPAHLAFIEAFAADLMNNQPAGTLRLPAQHRCDFMEIAVRSASSVEVHENNIAASQTLGPVGMEILRRLSVPLEWRLTAVMSALPTSSKLHSSQHPTVVLNAELCLELFRGMARATDSRNQKAVANLCAGLLAFAPQIADAFLEHQSVVLGVLEFLRDFAEAQISMLEKQQANQLYEASGKVLKIYAEHHIGLVDVNAAVEEEAFIDIMCVLQLLTHLVTKDLIDYSEDCSNSDQLIHVSDVIFYGLGKILPLMTENLLQFPSLCTHYFSLVSFMIETYADKLQTLEASLFFQLTGSILYGMKHSDVSVARQSMQAMNELASYHSKSISKGQPGLAVHKTVKEDLFYEPLKVLLEMIIFQPGIWDRINICASTLFTLIVCESNGFQALVGTILQSQQNETIRQRMEEAFNKLVRSEQIVFDLSNSNKNKFKDNLNIFVTSVRSFLSTH